MWNSRVLYEVFPMSFLMEQAGGQAFTGKQRVYFSFPFSDPQFPTEKILMLELSHLPEISGGIFNLQVEIIEKRALF
jgi:hypothetical protein